MAREIYIPIDLNGNEIQNFIVQNLGSAPGTFLTAGRVYFNTGDSKLYYYDGSAFQQIPSLAEINSSLEGLAWKDNVVAATTANITIATDLNVGDIIDDVTLADGDRVLVKDQTTQTENGIYIAGASPARADDMNTSAEFNNAIVPIDTGGTVNGGLAFRCENVDPVVGTDNITFTAFGGTVADASTTTKGKVELATQTETNTKTDTGRAVTPSGLADFAQQYSSNVGNGSDTDFVITHNYNTRVLNINVFRNSSPWDKIVCGVELTSVNSVTLKFTVAPTTDEFVCIINKV